MRIGIVGLGLIGGSLAKALAARTNHEIVGDDIDEDVVLKAREDGAISSFGSLEGCEVVFVCLHPYAAADWLKNSDLPEGTIVADTCGIKRYIHDEAAAPLLEKGLRYVGTHPMAGREVGGYESSREDLFSGGSWILTCDENSDPGAMSIVEDIVRAAGASEIPVTTAAEHDRIVAYTSQMAHAVSNAYVKNKAALEERGFSAGSFQDLTRVARMDPDLWTQLFMANADNLVENIDEFIENLRAIRNSIYDGDDDRLRSLLASGSERRIAITEMEKTFDASEKKQQDS